jgi:hypothetical protein
VVCSSLSAASCLAIGECTQGECIINRCDATPLCARKHEVWLSTTSQGENVCMSQRVSPWSRIDSNSWLIHWGRTERTDLSELARGQALDVAEYWPVRCGIASTTYKSDSNRRLSSCGELIHAMKEKEIVNTIFGLIILPTVDISLHCLMLALDNKLSSRKDPLISPTLRERYVLAW